MEIYSTEEQQAEAIKRFFRENGLALGIGIVAGLGGLYGWKAYNQSQITNAENASDSFNQLVESGAVLENADNFIKNNSESSYSTLAAFVAAKEAVEKGDLDTASEKLNWIITNEQSKELKATATMRLARVHLAQKQFEQALTTLNAQLPASFTAAVAELKGDVYAAQGDKAEARSQYQAAADNGGLDNNPLLQIKLDDLAQTSPAA